MKQEEDSVRRTPALISAVAATVLVAATLAGCSSSGSASGCSPVYSAGDASKIVTATGKIGGTPKATFPTPIVAPEPQVSVLKEGHGAVAQRGSQVDFTFTIFDGKTGDELGNQAYRTAAGYKISHLTSALSRSLECTSAGERFVLTGKAGTIFGKGALSSSSVSDSENLVVVSDVTGVYLGKANGANQLPKDGMPNVITAVSGQPGIVIQELDKPTTVRSEVVKAGGGKVVKRNDKVVLHVTAFTWPSASGDKPTVVSAIDTWANNQAATLKMESLAKGGSLPDAVIDALVGQKIGSQVLVVTPPKDGFEASALPTGVTAKDTVIFVVDLLGIDD